MYFTYVVRPGEAPEGKGPQMRPFWDGLMNYKLRGGFALQLLGYGCVLVSAMAGKNVFQIFEVLNGSPDALKDVPILVAFMGMLSYTVGSLAVQNFRIITDDDASIRQSRGFRAGLKCLHQASLLDIFSAAMSTVLLFSFIYYFEDIWTTKETGNGSTAIYASIARTLHSIALMLYGASFFFIENFHGEGTAEMWGWSLAFFYIMTGLFGNFFPVNLPAVLGRVEFFCLISMSAIATILLDICFTLSLGATLLFSLMWACAFEIVVNQGDVKLTQSAIRNEYYKSQNAIAYYGPPSGVELNNVMSTVQ